MNKMNVLHWHAVDADSFPLAMDAFPGLAAKGAYSPRGIYSVADQVAVVEHARHHGVRVLLETDVPGHSTAWSLAVPGIFITCPALGISQDFGGVQRVLDPTLNATWVFLDTFIAELAGRFPDRYV